MKPFDENTNAHLAQEALLAGMQDRYKPAPTASPVGIKHDTDKPAMAFIPPLAALELGKAYAAGEKKYGPWNYRNGLAATRCLGGTLRHTFQWLSGEDYDKETGVHHLACAAANTLMALENVLLHPSSDDRHKGNK